MLNSYAFTRHNLIGYNNRFSPNKAIIIIALLGENRFHVTASEFDFTISACLVLSFLPNSFGLLFV